MPLEEKVTVLIPNTDPRSAAFDEFWKAYPRKVGKAKARQLFMRITNGGYRTRTLEKDSGQYVELELQATPEELIAAAKSYAAGQVDKTTFTLIDGGKYIPHPSTWLNQGRFEDEL